MTKTRFGMLLVGALAWLALGVVGLAAHGGWQIDLAQGVVIFPAIPIALLSSGSSRGMLWDSAHGPPFLNIAGIVVVYFIPAVIALGWLLWTRDRSHVA